MGNVLHRLRVPRKVEEAGQLLETGVSIEAYDLLEETGVFPDNREIQAALGKQAA